MAKTVKSRGEKYFSHSHNLITHILENYRSHLRRSCTCCVVDTVCRKFKNHGVGMQIDHTGVKLKRRSITHKEVTSKDYAALTASQTGDE
jgi:uncharacterized protein (UPF0218 family)